jgi:hypothetical protein
MKRLPLRAAHLSSISVRLFSFSGFDGCPCAFMAPAKDENQDRDDDNQQDIVHFHLIGR